jgi:hypothetical protein
MSLKKEITDVLDALGATEQEKGRLVEYFVNRAAEASALVASIETNIASLQKQLEEATALRDATLAGISKFVTAEDQAKARRA